MAQNLRLTTPKGIARYPRLNSPDTKFDANGVYKVDLIVPAKEAQAFVKKVTEIRDEFAAKEKTKKKAALPFEKEEDDSGKETGNIIIKCKVKNIETKQGEMWDRKPKLFDAAGNKIDVSVGGGSKIKANVEVYTWASSALGAGVTLQPIAVQVIDLVEYTAGGSAEDFGFDKEDGFVSDETFEEEDSDAVEADEESEDSDLF